MFGKNKKTAPEEKAETAAPVPEDQKKAEEKTVAEVPETQETPATEQTPEVPQETETDKLRKELEEEKNKLLYLQADYQNYRRRMIKELSDARQIGVIGTLEPFLRIADFLGMADMAAHQSDNVEAIRQGLAMIINEFNKALDDLSVKKLDSVGKKFDPDKQEAVLQEASETVPEGVVIKEWSPAYMMGDRCIRAAKVVVSTGKPAPAETEKPEETAPEKAETDAEDTASQEA